MIVYRDRKRKSLTRALLSRLEPAASASARDALVEFGEFESGVADDLSPDADSDHPLLARLRVVALTAGRALWHSHTNTGGAAGWLRRLGSELARLRGEPLPESVELSVPEGFAYYGLYPECYLESAREFFGQARPRTVVVIGIRSIGTALSAVVAGALRELGCEVFSWTVRPRGHPFERTLALDPALERLWSTLSAAWFAIVDEGPGLSGSSFASVAQRLSELGIPDRRIVLFPSFAPDGSAFVSESARRRWQRHVKYVKTFEQVRPGPGLDVSAGAWRPLLYAREHEYPAVHPQHERRKYLRTENGGCTLLKFAGVGRYGHAALERARELAGAGFASPVLGLEDGLLATVFETGRPCLPHPGQELLERIASYSACLAGRFPCSAPIPWEELVRMIETNTLEGLGPPWAASLSCLHRFRPAVSAARTVAIDGRMLPHEWIETPRGFLKTDAVDHHCDHFFPGTQDIAWDLAGTIVEFALEPAARLYLLSKYRSLSRDSDIARRIPFYLIAYPAYRLGYCALALTALGDSPDGRRFACLRDCYARTLREEIQRHG